MTQVLVLLSGGPDSSVLVRIADDAMMLAGCLFVDYGQPAAAEELRAAQRLCRDRIRLYVSTISGLDLGQMRHGEGAQVVPGRNALLLSLAANLCPSIGADTIWIGAIRNDAADYADCRGEFFEAWNAAQATIGGPRVEAPLIQASKHLIPQIAARVGLDLALTVSCYAPKDGVPCGECESCRVRSDAGF